MSLVTREPGGSISGNKWIDKRTDEKAILGDENQINLKTNLPARFSCATFMILFSLNMILVKILGFKTKSKYFGLRPSQNTLV